MRRSARDADRRDRRRPRELPPVRPAAARGRRIRRRWRGVRRRIRTLGGSGAAAAARAPRRPPARHRRLHRRRGAGAGAVAAARDPDLQPRGGRPGEAAGANPGDRLSAQGRPLGIGAGRADRRHMTAARARLALAALGGALGLYAIALAVWVPDALTLPIAVHVAIGWSFPRAGILARGRPPDHPTRLLMLLTGARPG